MKDRLITFLYAYMQVTLICLNTWQIANNKIIGSIIVGFLISLIWCFNTQRVAFSNLYDKVIYATGACCGTASGLTLSNILY
jgi:hypothetical protein